VIFHRDLCGVEPAIFLILYACSRKFGIFCCCGEAEGRMRVR
jgi:hypothetical protein